MTTRLDGHDNQPLITRHRPHTFDGVYGHGETVAALQRRIADPRRPHAYLFTGPSGVGKTTIARIIGNTLESHIDEYDAASNNGVDAMRALVESGHYLLPGAQSRLIILDEAHMLSRAAWNATLKILEEPPDHLYLALCTTEPAKVPNTVFTRCHHIKLNCLRDEEIANFIADILDKEGWSETIREDVFDVVVQEACGSPRQALSLLQALYDAPSFEEAQRIVRLQQSSSTMTKIISLVMNGQGNWQTVRPLLAQIPDDDFCEGALVHAARYVIGALNREESDKQASRMWSLLSALLYPVHSFDAKSTFYHAIGRSLWSQL